MDNWDELAVVGRIARPHGIKGQVIVNAETDFPELRFRPGVELFVRRADRVETIRLTTVRFHQGRPIIGIEGVADMNEATAWAGVELRVPVEQLAALDPGTFYRHDLVGCAVETTAGQGVGVVTNVEGAVNGSRLIVETGRGEALIPLVAAICTSIDVRAKKIVIDPPDGLIELNLKTRD